MSERDSLQVAYYHVLADLRGKLAGVDTAIAVLEEMRRGTCMVAVSSRTFDLLNALPKEPA